MTGTHFLKAFGLLLLSGCASFPENVPPSHSQEFLLLEKTLTVKNLFNTHYVGSGKYKFSGTVAKNRFYRPQDPTLFSHDPIRYVRIDPDVKNEVCVVYYEGVNCIETSYKIIDGDKASLDQ